jgi:hypothetical protein
VRLLKIAVLAAAVFLTACEKAEDRAVLDSGPKSRLRYCADGDIAPIFRMSAGWCVASNNRAYVLDLAPEGVLRVRAVRDGRPQQTIWSSTGKAKKPDTSIMVFQPDGDLRVYDPIGQVWHSGVLGPGDYRLSLTDYGDLLIRAADDRVLWAAWLDFRVCSHSLQGTTLLGSGCLASPSGNYVLVVQPDGDAQVAPVIDPKTLGKPIWSSGTRGSSPRSTYAAVQDDGNFVIYDGPTKPIWNTHTSNHPGAVRLELTDEGELRLRNADGLLWSSKTGRTPAGA